MGFRRPTTRIIVLAALVIFSHLLLSEPVHAQGSHHDLDEKKTPPPVDPKAFEGLSFRPVSFSRGGRSTAVAGVPNQPLSFYFGGTGSGVWKTLDAGISWHNVSDGYLGVGSVGAIEVAPSDPNVVYVGTGSACPRGNISTGDGVYRSTDAGNTWVHLGLRHAGQIGRIRVHPDDPDIVWVAALGHIFGPNKERGIFRSRDGGKSWEKILYLSDRTGFVDLALDVTNPRILYAAAWRAERKPWTLISGSEEGGVFKTTNGGDSWEKLAGGLPEGIVGKIGITVSPAKHDRVWALIEAEKGGVYRSDDAGLTWQRVNDEAKLRQRPWYYSHIYADPKDPDTVYALNTGFYKSVDGGLTFPTQLQVPHGDNHDLWINPDNPNNMVNGNDGGANVTFNGGISWTTQMNQPTAEIYRVFVDDQWPYRIYGSQQDNTTISVPSRGSASFNTLPPDWYQVGGCESGHIAIDPRDPNITYAGCYGGNIDRVNRNKGESRQILSYPQLQLGQAARDLKYRFQWNAPIRLSPHDPDVLYHTSQVVHRSRDSGQSWEVISPDLTTDDPETQDYAGGPISHDSTGIEVYNTIFAFEESPHIAGLLWTGSDDGRLHISHDHGANWLEVTPPEIPSGGTVNEINLSVHSPGRATIAVYRYREDDFAPYIFQTNNYGVSWERLTDGTNGIPATHFVRTVAEDPNHEGLLYAGTEFGLYVSFDNGARWQSFQRDLPITPVTGIRVHRKDVVVATQGRGFWILENVSPLHEISNTLGLSGTGPQSTGRTDLSQALFTPRIGYRGGDLGGLHIDYYFAAKPNTEVTLEIINSEDEVVRMFKDMAEENAPAASSPPSPIGTPIGTTRLPVEAGLNRFTWDLREEGLQIPDGVVLWGRTVGIGVAPGSYAARLSVGDWSDTRQFQIQTNPGGTTTAADFREQYDLLKVIASHITDLYDHLTQLRGVKTQVNMLVERLRKASTKEIAEEITEAAQRLVTKLSEIEQQLTQVKSRSSQDPLNFPPMLDNQFITLYSYIESSDFRPTAGARKRLADLEPQLNELLQQLDAVLDADLADFNKLVRNKNIGPVIIGTK